MRTAVAAPAPKPSIDEIIAAVAALPVVELLDIRAEILRRVLAAKRRAFEEQFPGHTLGGPPWWSR